MKLKETKDNFNKIGLPDTQTDAILEIVEAKVNNDLEKVLAKFDAEFKVIDSRFKSIDIQFKAVDVQFKVVFAILLIIVAGIIAVFFK